MWASSSEVPEDTRKENLQARGATFRTFLRPFSSPEGIPPPKVSFSELSKTTFVTNSIKSRQYLWSTLRYQVI